MSAYRAFLEIDFDPDAGAVTPVRMEVDFSRFLPTEKLVDPHTLKVVRKRADGSEKEYRPWFSEMLYYGNEGHIALAVDDPRAGGEWRLVFRERGSDGELAPFPEHVPPVGVGDELLLNNDRWAPMRVPGMHPFPIAVDWDEDGRMDILSTSHYSNALDMPQAGVFLFRNSGSEAEPRFSVPLRLYAEGVDERDDHDPGVFVPVFPSTRAPDTESSSQPVELAAFPARKGFISEYYLRADVYPWFGSGRVDLITMSGQSRHIKIYRNTGEKDGVGLPRLELALKLPKPSGMIGYVGLRVVDWDGEGRPSLVVGAGAADTTRIRLLRNLSDDPHHPDLWEVPMLQGCLDREFTDLKPWTFDLFDLDGDGELELITMHELPPAGPTMKVYKNGGSKDRPRWYDVSNTRWFRHNTSLQFRFTAEGPLECGLGWRWRLGSDHRRGIGFALLPPAGLGGETRTPLCDRVSLTCSSVRRPARWMNRRRRVFRSGWRLVVVAAVRVADMQPAWTLRPYHDGSFFHEDAYDRHHRSPINSPRSPRCAFGRGSGWHFLLLQPCPLLHRILQLRCGARHPPVRGQRTHVEDL